MPDDNTIDPTKTVVPPVVEPPKEKTTAELLAEVEHWKSFSRKNEDGKKAEFEKVTAANARIAELEAANMTDAEKTIADAKASGHSEALKTVGIKLVKAELKVAAAEAGVEIPKTLPDYMDLSKLLDAKGEPNAEAIKDLVSSFKPTNAFSQNLGIGAPSGATGARDWAPNAIADRVRKLNPYTTL
jgi:hypothetical protein